MRFNFFWYNHYHSQIHAMERSEPSLAPQWLRSNGCGNSIHQFASSQADGSILAFPVSRSLKSVGNSDSLRSPLLDRTSASDIRRSTISNMFNKQDQDSHALSYSSFSKSRRGRDRERLITDRSRGSEYCDPMKGMINGRAEDPSRRSQSFISSRQSVPQHFNVPSDMRNDINKTHDGTHTVGGNGNSIHKVSFEREFPVLGFEERPKTPDVVRVSSPGLSRGTQSFPIGIPPLVGSEGWTSALAEVPQSSSSCSSSISSSTSSGLNMAEALMQASAQSHNAPQVPQPSIQSVKDELALAHSKKLIPVTSLLNKTMVLGASDKSKPKTTMRSSETAVTPKNGVHLQPLLVGSQPVRGDDPKSPSGKLLLLKHGRENGVSPGLKDLQVPTTNVNTRVANGQSTDSPTASSGPLKNSHNTQILHGPVIDKRTSRSYFFKLMREKSVNNTPGAISGASASFNVVDKLDKEPTELGSDETGNEVKCNGETCTIVDNLAPTPSVKISHEDERAFLLSLGWEDKVEDGEEGLTKEEIDTFCKKVIEQGAASRLCRLLQAKLLLHVGCSSNELSTPISQVISCFSSSAIIQ